MKKDKRVPKTEEIIESRLEKKETKDLDSTMSKLAATMSKKFGDKSMLFLKEHPDYAKVKNWISTQNYALDWVCSGKADGTGGLPIGRIIELFGDPSSGKSLLLAHVLSEVQKRGGIPVLYDVEGTFDMYFATRIGLDINKLLYTKAYQEVKRKKKVLGEDGKLHELLIDVKLPATVEKMREMIEELIDITYYESPGALLVIGLDSVAGLATTHELEEPDKKDLTKASEIRSFIKSIEAKMADSNCIFIATNHVIANIKIENKFEKKTWKKEGPKEDKSAPGGSGLPFGSSVRLDLTRGYDIKESKVLTIGHEINVFSHKNKVYSPHKQAVIEMKFETGVVRYSGLLPILVAKGVTEEMGDQVFRYKGIRFKERPQERPAKYPGLEEIINKHPEILSEANEV